MKLHESRGGGARGTSRRRTPAAIDRITDALETRWGSLPEVEVSLGMRVRLAGIKVEALTGERLA